MLRSNGERWFCTVMLVMVIRSVNSLPNRISMLNRFVLAGPNEPLPWTEMDLNRGPPPPATPFYSREEMSCFEDRKVYYAGKCWELRLRGPCAEGQLLVLDAYSNGLKAVCQQKICESDRAYWKPTGECIKLTDRTKCNKKLTSLQVDNLGYGACKCTKGLARAMASNGACYQLYTRGFCDPGYVVVMDQNADEYPAICARDTCNSTSPDVTLLPYKGGCYPEGSTDPCPEGQSLTVEVHRNKPACGSDLNTWHLFNPPPRCPHLDHNGDCRDKLTVKEESDNYILELQLDRKKHKKRYGVSKGKSNGLT